MRILVTGSTGQVGRAIRNYANGIEAEFLFSDSSSMDITNEVEVRDVILGFKPKVIVNAAAYTAVDRAEENEELCRLVNATALKYISKESQALEEEPLIIHISTDYVYHPDHKELITENEEKNPQSVYARTKLEGEEILLRNSNSCIIIRTSWVYDEGGANFVNTMLRLGKSKDSLNVVSDQVGSPTYAGDIADVILKCISKWEIDKARFDETNVFNFSNEGFTNWAEFAQEIMKLSGSDCVIHPIPTVDYPTPATRPLNSRLDKSLISEFLEIEIRTWKEALAECLRSQS